MSETWNELVKASLNNIPKITTSQEVMDRLKEKF
jgi:hypothetical protein